MTQVTAADPRRFGADRATVIHISEHLQLRIADRLALLILNDPDRRNAITPELAADMREAVYSLDHDERAHALVITGAGSAFCAGADRGVLRSADAGCLRQIYSSFLAVAQCALPTIAAVNGPAVGAGLNLALACDVRIAGARAHFDSRFLALGVHPGGGATWMLQRAIGPSLARAVLLFGLSFDAEAAVRTGLAVTAANDPVAAAGELASGACSAPRDIVVNTKATMRSTVTPGTEEIELHTAAVDLEIGPQVRSLRSAFDG
jgi:enoyl-CoA hydratase